MIAVAHAARIPAMRVEFVRAVLVVALGMLVGVAGCARSSVQSTTAASSSLPKDDGHAAQAVPKPVPPVAIETHPVGAGVVTAPVVHPLPLPVAHDHEAGHGEPAAARHDALSQHVKSWYDQLKQGKIEYNVPASMKWKEASTVTVVLHGYQAPASALPAQTGSGGLKVSDRMKVILTDPDNPDEFTIAKQQGTDDIQFVPIDGTTTWNWSVTPKYTTRVPQKLVIAAWVLYPGEKDEIAQALPVYSATVAVRVPGIGDALRRLVEGDPEYWLKYGLPGGGGFIFIAGMVAWLRQRRARLVKVAGADVK